MEIGKTEEEIKSKLQEVIHNFFYGEDKVYFPVGDDMAYIEDTGNHDARTEGMSYGMMMCVQMDMKEEFDRLWKWSKTYMWMAEGWNEGYFAWSCQVDGKKNANGPAPDGEEFFAMALLWRSFVQGSPLRIGVPSNSAYSALIPETGWQRQRHRVRWHLTDRFHWGMKIRRRHLQRSG